MTWCQNCTDKDGVLELHEHKDDAMVVQGGEAVLVYGGKGEMKVISPGELRGTWIEGGTSVQVGPGDVITIATGVSPQFFVPRGRADHVYIGGDTEEMRFSVDPY